MDNKLINPQIAPCMDLILLLTGVVLGDYVQMPGLGQLGSILARPGL